MTRAAVPFVLFTITRSGSTWLLSLLNGQKGVAAYEELFLWRTIDQPYAWLSEGSPERFYTRRAALGGPQPQRLWRYLGEVESHTPGAHAAGFKLMVGQLREAPTLLPILAARRYRMIVLLRDNLFEGAVSRVVLETTGDAHGGDQGGEQQRLTLDPARLVSEMKKRRRGLEILRNVQRFWPWPSVAIRYEDLVRDQAETLRPVLSTLGLRQEPELVTSELKRRIRTPYEELIGNFEEICGAVSAAGLGDALPAARRTT